MAASISRLSYQRLTHEAWFEDDDDFQLRERVIGRAKSWPKIRKVHLKKRFKVKIPSLKRLLRRKTRVLMVTWAKILKRLRESQSHFGDLFAGNYMFMQVTPTPLKCGNKYLKGNDLHGFSYNYSVPRISQ